MRMLILLITVVFVCGCQKEQGSIQKNNGPDALEQQPAESVSTAKGTDEIVIVVHGMSCPLCATNLRKKIMSLDGITAVYPDLDTGDVGVRYEAGKKPSYQQIEELVKQSGFTLVKIKG